MAKWQPPIPAGALYSKAARKLGPALPLLAYCYDKVGKDGWLDISLKEVAGDMEESYQSIKRYWWALKDGPFFAETIDRGRLGWRVRFKDVWVDWRILNARAVASDPFSEGTKYDLEEGSHAPDTHENAQGHLKVISRSNEGTKYDLENNVYGTHDSDQAVFADAPKSAPPVPSKTRAKPERSPDEQAYLDRKKAIESAYVTALGYKPAAFAAEAKAAKWLAEQGYTPEQVVGCYEHLRADSFYDKKHIRLQTVANQIGAWLQANRQRPARASPNIPLIQAPPANTKPKLSAEETRAILAEYNPRFRT